MRNFEVYIKKTPCSDWQCIGTVHSIEHANSVEKKATAQGYYFKKVEV